MTRMEEKSYLKKAWWVGLSALVVTACGGDAPKRDISEPPLRAGGLLEPINLVYNDEQPALSADGTKLVFASGRLTTDAAFSVKVFKSDWPVGGTPSAPVRLSATDDLGLERAAVISPDGKWVVVTSTVSGRSDLYLIKYADGASVRVTDDVASESSVVFSPDSKLLMWISRGLDDAGKATAAARVVEIGTGTADELARSQALSLSGATNVATAFWASMDGANYRAAVGITNSISGRSTLSLFAFATAADAATAVAETWREGVRFDEKVPTVVAGTQALFTEKVLSTAMKLIPRSGNFEEETPSSMQVASETALGTVGEDTATPTALPAGYRILSTGLSATGDTTFVLANQAYRCNPDGGLLYRNGIAVAAPGATALTRLVPRLTADAQGFEVAADFCDSRRADDSVGRVDDRIEAMVVNSAATATTHRVVYVSRFTSVFDKSCGLVLGDREIYGIDVTGDGKRIVPISSNRAPLTNADRGGEAPCVL